MGDLISRQAAIDAVNRAATKEAARWSIQELPSEQKGCDGCAFDAVSTKNYPCSACIRSFRDLWTEEEE